jgi:hypothetical protein
MKEVVLGVPELMFVVATRAALGVGIGLLIAERLPRRRRRAIGAALFAAGAATTIPAIQTIVRSTRGSSGMAAEAEYDRNLAGTTRYARKGDDPY